MFTEENFLFELVILTISALINVVMGITIVSVRPCFSFVVGSLDTVLINGLKTGLAKVSQLSNKWQNRLKHYMNATVVGMVFTW